MMTKEEFAAKQEIIDILRRGGYKTYAELVNLFDINLTNDPDIAAAVDINKARIILNRGVPAESISTLIRHELLHRWLEHNFRLEQHVGKDKWDRRTRREAELGNIAGDYEISNRGYTKKDEEIVRNLKLRLPDGSIKPFAGLVTELDHPDWVNLSIEEMYDKLKEEADKKEQEALNDINNMANQMEQENNDSSSGDGKGNDSPSSSNNNSDKKSQAYIDGWRKAIEDYKAGKLRI